MTVIIHARPAKARFTAPYLSRLWGIVVLCVISLVASPAFAQHNDPIQLCKLDHGKTWYFAISRTVFEIKNPNYFQGGPLVNNADPKDALVSPDPTSPVGCKENPQQLSGFTILNWPRLEPVGYSGPMPTIAEISGMHRYPYSNTLPPNIDPAILGIEDVAEKCRNKKFIKRFEGGTFLCADKLGQLNPLLSSGQFYHGIGWEFIISGNLYLTPLGQNLVVSEDTTGIQTGYRLAAGVEIGYMWFPSTKTTNIGEKFLINVDKVFQAKISTYQIKNYPWP